MRLAMFLGAEEAKAAMYYLVIRDLGNAHIFDYHLSATPQRFSSEIDSRCIGNLWGIHLGNVHGM